MSNEHVHPLFRRTLYDIFPFQSTTPFLNEALIEGHKVKYDALGSDTLQAAMDFYGPKYDYIGSGETTYHDGVENNWGKPLHFFIIKKP